MRRVFLRKELTNEGVNELEEDRCPSSQSKNLPQFPAFKSTKVRAYPD